MENKSYDGSAENTALFVACRKFNQVKNK